MRSSPEFTPYESPGSFNPVGKGDARRIRWAWLFVVFPRIAALSFLFLVVAVVWGAGHNIDDPITLIDYIGCYGSLGLSTLILVGGAIFCSYRAFEAGGGARPLESP